MAAKILIIEDEIAVREMLTFTLKNSGFETFEAGNSEEALNIVLKNNINLILLYWMLLAPLIEIMPLLFHLAIS